MTNTITTDSPKTPTQGGGANYTTTEKVFLLGVALIAAWLLVCTASAFWLDLQVPVSAQDLAYSSWRQGFTTPMHLNGVMAHLLIGLIGFSTVAIAVIRKSAKFVVLGVLAAAAVFQASSESTMVRVGIDTGSIKIGCFVYESKECLDMLNVQHQGAPSIYANGAQGARGQVNADWYLKALPEHASSFMDMMPGGYLLRTPFLIGRESQLRDKIAAQRAEVVAIQKLNAVPLVAGAK